MKKGFTLIELLAVIVILAIIAVITVPIIGNVIEESKKQALESSVKGIIDATNYFAITNNGVYEFIFDENNKGVTVDGKSLEYTGDVDAKGKLVLDRQGNISLCLMNDNYYIYKNYNSGIVVGNKAEDSCDVSYDVLTNKYIAFLESEGSASNVYSKDEVNNLISATTNEITNIKTSVETLQNNLSNYALKSELETTNSNIETLSSLITDNTSDINTNTNELTNIKSKIETIQTSLNSYALKSELPTIQNFTKTTGTGNGVGYAFINVDEKYTRAVVTNLDRDDYFVSNVVRHGTGSFKLTVLKRVDNSWADNITISGTIILYES